jgi:hypothetical protein
MVIKSCKNTLICSPNNLGLTHFLNRFHTSRTYRIQIYDSIFLISDQKVSNYAPVFSFGSPIFYGFLNYAPVCHECCLHHRSRFWRLCWEFLIVRGLIWAFFFCANNRGIENVERGFDFYCVFVIFFLTFFLNLNHIFCVNKLIFLNGIKSRCFLVA